MENRYVAVLVLVFLGISFVYGSTLTEQCVQIQEFKGCWSIVDKTVKSDLCANGKECIARPAQQQHNAVVDVLLSACDKARKGNYADTALTKRIEEVGSTFTGYSIDARTMCDQPGLVLAKSRYE